MEERPPQIDDFDDTDDEPTVQEQDQPTLRTSLDPRVTAAASVPKALARPPVKPSVPRIPLPSKVPPKLDDDGTEVSERPPVDPPREAKAEKDATEADEAEETEGPDDQTRPLVIGRAPATTVPFIAPPAPPSTEEPEPEIPGLELHRARLVRGGGLLALLTVVAIGAFMLGRHTPAATAPADASTWTTSPSSFAATPRIVDPPPPETSEPATPPSEEPPPAAAPAPAPAPAPPPTPRPAPAPPPPAIAKLPPRAPAPAPYVRPRRPPSSTIIRDVPF